MTQPAETVASTTTIGKYRLLAQIGRGGMAEVFLAVQRGPANFSKFLVVKRMKTSLIGDIEFVKMFNDEARLAARLNHPNIVQTNEAGSTADDHYIVMEYLDGQPYHRVLHRAARSGRGLSLALKVAVLIDVLTGLHYAHELKDYDGTPLGVVHRDATPHNIFITYQGEVKVVDFGIAKALGRSIETRVGVIKGKVHYMAPEQAMGKGDRRSDVFAIGVILWESITGRRYWGKISDLDILRRLVSGDMPPDPRSLPGLEVDVPEELNEICAQALAPGAAARFASAEAFARALEDWLGTLPSRPTARELGPVMTELFASERQTMKMVIETKLKELEAIHTQNLSSGEFELADFGASGGPMSLSSPSMAMSAASIVGLPQKPPATPQASTTPPAGTPPPVSIPHPPAAYVPRALVDSSHSPPPAPQRTPMRAWLPVAVSAVLFCGGAAFALVGLRGTTSAGATADPTPASNEVTVSITAVPAGAARLWLDGTSVPNPYTGRHAKSAGAHLVRAAAPGYRAQTVTVVFDKDVAKTLKLDPER